MAKYDIAKILIALLEKQVEGFLGKDAIAELKRPVTKAKLQAELLEAAKRAEKRWLESTPELYQQRVMKEMFSKNEDAVAAAVSSIYASPTQPLTANILRNQLHEIAPTWFNKQEIEETITSYLEILRQELIEIDGVREKLVALAAMATEGNTKLIVENTKYSAKSGETTAQNTTEIVKQLSYLNQRLEQQAYPITIPEDKLGEIEATYRQMLIANFENLDFKGQIDTTEPLLLPLEKIYVQLRAVTNVPERDEFTPEERRLLRALEKAERDKSSLQPSELREAQIHIEALRRERWTKDKQERFEIAEMLQNSERRGLVILGDPGSGKSTLLKFLALVFARGPAAVAEHLKITGAEALRLPIFAPLAYYDECLNKDRTLTLDDFLGHYYEHEAYPGLDPLFRHAIAAGHALILLDGLDEVVKEDRRQFISEQASTFIRRILSQGNRILLTSRIYGYSTARLSVDLPHVTVLDFQRENIAVFARQFNQALAEWEYRFLSPDQRYLKAQDEERQLLNEIYSNPAVERLAANPLMLSMLALLRRKVGHLPQRRIKLYAQYLEALIERWETVRSRNTRVETPIKYDTSTTEFTLIPLALWLHKNKPSGTAEETEIVAQISGNYLQEQGYEFNKSKKIPENERRIAQERAQKFLNDMRQFSGLLVERGYNAFDFRHLTFREYYVGRALARMDASSRWRQIKPNLHANRWREPLLLAAAQLGIVQADSKAATALIKKILGAQSEYEEILHRDLFLAADCASDDINIEVSILRYIARKLKLLTNSPILALRTASIRYLSNLALLKIADKPRLPEAAETLLNVVSSLQKSDYQMLVEIIEPLFPIYPALKQAIAAKLDDQDREVRVAAILALKDLLERHLDLRQVVLQKLDDQYSDARIAAIHAVTSLLSEHSDLRNTIASKLYDPYKEVRIAAIQALTPLLERDINLRQTVVANISSPDSDLCAAAIEAVANLLGNREDLCQVVISKLDQPEEKYGNVRTTIIHSLTPFLGESVGLRQIVAAKLDDNDVEVRAASVDALKDFLSEHADLRKAVATKLDDIEGKVRAAAIRSLTAQLCDHADLRRAVAAKLDDIESAARLAAIHAISTLPEKFYRVYITEIARGLHELNCLEAIQGCTTAMRALTPLLGEHPDLRHAVAAKLDNQNEFVRATAIEAVTDLLGKDANLRQVVVTKLDDRNWYVVTAAIKALTTLLGDHADLRQAVAAKLNDQDSDIFSAAITALTSFLANNANLRQVIITKLNDRNLNWEASSKAIRALTPLLGENAELRQAVASKLNDRVGSVRVAAITALTELLGEHANLRQAVAAGLEDPNSYVCATTIEALTDLLVEHADLRQAVIAKLDDQDSDIRSAAIIALRNMLGRDTELRQTIITKLNDQNDKSGCVRAAAIKALAPLVVKDTDLRQAIVLKMDDPDDKNGFIRNAAFQALTPLLDKDNGLRQLIISLMSHQDSDMRSSAIGALKGLLDEYTDLRQAIATKLDDKNAGVRLAAIEALMPFLGESTDLREAVVATLYDKDWYVRIFATHILAFLIPSQKEIRVLLKRALSSGVIDVAFPGLDGSYSQGNLIPNFGKWIQQDLNGRAEIIAMIQSEDANCRKSAIEILDWAGKEALLEAKPQLLKALDDCRGYESWPRRIITAELLLNHIDYSQQAVTTLLDALEYGTDPLVFLRDASEIRKSATLALGKLKAEFRSPAIGEKIKDLLAKEDQPQVLDSLFSALQSLAAAPE